MIIFFLSTLLVIVIHVIVVYCGLQSLLHALRVHLHFHFHSYRNSNRYIDLCILCSRLNHRRYLRYFILIKRIFPSAGPECAGHLYVSAPLNFESSTQADGRWIIFYMYFISTFLWYTLLFHNAIRQYYVISELVRCEQHSYATMEERVSREKKTTTITIALSTPLRSTHNCSLLNYAKRVLMRVRDGHECRIRSRWI